VSPPRRRDLERALRVRLPLHFPEIDVVPRSLRQQPGEIDPRLPTCRSCRAVLVERGDEAASCVLQ
jgi:hypothetical protein